MGTKAEDLLDNLIAECLGDPLKYVMAFFPWQYDASIQIVKLPDAYRDRFPKCVYGPDLWACQFLDQLGQDIINRGFDGRTAVNPIQYTTASGHGIGKSVMVAWLTKFISDTRPFSKGTITANTVPQLRSKTWAEVGKWHKMSLTSHRFDYRSGQQLALRNKQFPDSWFCTAQTCKEENSESFAGQHAVNSTSYYIFDEASAVPSKIYEVRAGGLTDGEPMTFDFGNPTRNSGEFYENCVGSKRQNFRFFQVDSRSVAITNKAYIDRQIADNGLDSDYVRVRVKGEFPEQGSVQFIGTQDVEDAARRELVRDRFAPLLIGVDVARHGMDQTVIKARIGNDARSWPARRFRGLDTVQVVGKVIEFISEFKALGVNCSGLFIDATGLGAGVYDQLNHLGYSPIEVHNSGRATDGQAYYRKGDEMWGDMRDAIRRNLCLPAPGDPEHDDMVSQLTGREFGYNKSDAIKLEPKDDMRERGIGSPDLADALALTFAQKVAVVRPEDAQMVQPTFSIHEYDPLEYR